MLDMIELHNNIINGLVMAKDGKTEIKPENIGKPISEAFYSEQNWFKLYSTGYKDEKGKDIPSEVEKKTSIYTADGPAEIEKKYNIRLACLDKNYNKAKSLFMKMNYEEAKAKDMGIYAIVKGSFIDGSGVLDQAGYNWFMNTITDPGKLEVLKEIVKDKKINNPATIISGFGLELTTLAKLFPEDEDLKKSLKPKELHEWFKEARKDKEKLELLKKHLKDSKNLNNLDDIKSGYDLDIQSLRLIFPNDQELGEIFRSRYIPDDDKYRNLQTKVIAAFRIFNSGLTDKDFKIFKDFIEATKNAVNKSIQSTNFLASIKDSNAETQNAITEVAKNVVYEAIKKIYFLSPIKEPNKDKEIEKAIIEAIQNPSFISAIKNLNKANKNAITEATKKLVVEVINSPDFIAAINFNKEIDKNVTEATKSPDFITAIKSYEFADTSFAPEITAMQEAANADSKKKKLLPELTADQKNQNKQSLEQAPFIAYFGEKEPEEFIPAEKGDKNSTSTSLKPLALDEFNKILLRINDGSKNLEGILLEEGIYSYKLFNLLNDKLSKNSLAFQNPITIKEYEKLLADLGDAKYLLSDLERQNQKNLMEKSKEKFENIKEEIEKTDPALVQKRNLSAKLPSNWEALHLKTIEKFHNNFYGNLFLVNDEKQTHISGKRLGEIISYISSIAYNKNTENIKLLNQADNATHNLQNETAKNKAGSDMPLTRNNDIPKKFSILNGGIAAYKAIKSGLGFIDSYNIATTIFNLYRHTSSKSQKIIEAGLSRSKELKEVPNNNDIISTPIDYNPSHCSVANAFFMIACNPEAYRHIANNSGMLETLFSRHNDLILNLLFENKKFSSVNKEKDIITKEKARDYLIFLQKMMMSLAADKAEGQLGMASVVQNLLYMAMGPTHDPNEKMIKCTFSIIEGFMNVLNNNTNLQKFLKVAENNRMLNELVEKSVSFAMEYMNSENTKKGIQDSEMVAKIKAQIPKKVSEIIVKIFTSISNENSPKADGVANPVTINLKSVIELSKKMIQYSKNISQFLDLLKTLPETSNIDDPNFTPFKTKCGEQFKTIKEIIKTLNENQSGAENKFVDLISDMMTQFLTPILISDGNSKIKTEDLKKFLDDIIKNQGAGLITLDEVFKLIEESFLIYSASKKEIQEKPEKKDKIKEASSNKISKLFTGYFLKQENIEAISTGLVKVAEEHKVVIQGMISKTADEAFELLPESPIKDILVEHVTTTKDISEFISEFISTTLPVVSSIIPDVTKLIYKDGVEIEANGAPKEFKIDPKDPELFKSIGSIASKLSKALKESTEKKPTEEKPTEPQNNLIGTITDISLPLFVLINKDDQDMIDSYYSYLDHPSLKPYRLVPQLHGKSEIAQKEIAKASKGYVEQFDRIYKYACKQIDEIEALNDRISKNQHDEAAKELRSFLQDDLKLKCSEIIQITINDNNEKIEITNNAIEAYRNTHEVFASEVLTDSNIEKLKSFKILDPNLIKDNINFGEVIELIDEAEVAAKKENPINIATIQTILEAKRYINSQNPHIHELFACMKMKKEDIEKLKSFNIPGLDKDITFGQALKLIDDAEKAAKSRNPINIDEIKNILKAKRAIKSHNPVYVVEDTYTQMSYNDYKTHLKTIEKFKKSYKDLEEILKEIKDAKTNIANIKKQGNTKIESEITAQSKREELKIKSLLDKIISKYTHLIDHEDLKLHSKLVKELKDLKAQKSKLEADNKNENEKLEKAIKAKNTEIENQYNILLEKAGELEISAASKKTRERINANITNPIDTQIKQYSDKNITEYKKAINNMVTAATSGMEFVVINPIKGIKADLAKLGVLDKQELEKIITDSSSLKKYIDEKENEKETLSADQKDALRRLKKKYSRGIVDNTSLFDTIKKLQPDFNPDEYGSYTDFYNLLQKIKPANNDQRKLLDEAKIQLESNNPITKFIQPIINSLDKTKDPKEFYNKISELFKFIIASDISSEMDSKRVDDISKILELLLSQPILASKIKNVKETSDAIAYLTRTLTLINENFYTDVKLSEQFNKSFEKIVTILTSTGASETANNKPGDLLKELLDISITALGVLSKSNRDNKDETQPQIANLLNNIIPAQEMLANMGLASDDISAALIEITSKEEKELEKPFEALKTLVELIVDYSYGNNRDDDKNLEVVNSKLSDLSDLITLFAGESVKNLLSKTMKFQLLKQSITQIFYDESKKDTIITKEDITELVRDLLTCLKDGSIDIKEYKELIEKKHLKLNAAYNEDNIVKLLVNINKLDQAANQVNTIINLIESFATADNKTQINKKLSQIIQGILVIKPDAKRTKILEKEKTAPSNDPPKQANAAENTEEEKPKPLVAEEPKNLTGKLQDTIFSTMDDIKQNLVDSVLAFSKETSSTIEISQAILKPSIEMLKECTKNEGLKKAFGTLAQNMIKSNGIDCSDNDAKNLSASISTVHAIASSLLGTEGISIDANVLKIALIESGALTVTAIDNVEDADKIIIALNTIDEPKETLKEGETGLPKVSTIPAINIRKEALKLTANAVIHVKAAKKLPNTKELVFNLLNNDKVLDKSLDILIGLLNNISTEDATGNFNNKIKELLDKNTPLINKFISKAIIDGSLPSYFDAPDIIKRLTKKENAATLANILTKIRDKKILIDQMKSDFSSDLLNSNINMKKLKMGAASYELIFMADLWIILFKTIAEILGTIFTNKLLPNKLKNRIYGKSVSDLVEKACNSKSTEVNIMEDVLYKLLSDPKLAKTNVHRMFKSKDLNGIKIEIPGNITAKIITFKNVNLKNAEIDINNLPGDCVINFENCTLDGLNLINQPRNNKNIHIKDCKGAPLNSSLKINSIKCISDQDYAKLAALKQIQGVDISQASGKETVTHLEKLLSQRIIQKNKKQI